MHLPPAVLLVRATLPGNLMESCACAVLWPQQPGSGPFALPQPAKVPQFDLGRHLKRAARGGAYARNCVWIMTFLVLKAA